jgi:hypothetical protein
MTAVAEIDQPRLRLRGNFCLQFWLHMCNAMAAYAPFTSDAPKSSNPAIMQEGKMDRSHQSQNSE